MFLLYCASLSQVIVMILCVIRGPDSTSRAQKNSRPSAIFHAFQPDGCSLTITFLVGDSIQAKNSKAIQLPCMVWIEIAIYSHLYRVLEFYLTFLGANELLYDRSCCLVRSLSSQT